MTDPKIPFNTTSLAVGVLPSMNSITLNKIMRTFSKGELQNNAITKVAIY